MASDKMLNANTSANIKAVAVPVLSHRVVINFHAASSGVRPADVIERLVGHVPVPGPNG